MNWLLVFGLLGIALAGWYLYSQGALSSVGLTPAGKVVDGASPALPPPGYAEGGLPKTSGTKTGFQPPPRQPDASGVKLTVTPSVGPAFSARSGRGAF